MPDHAAEPLSAAMLNGDRPGQNTAAKGRLLRLALTLIAAGLLGLALAGQAGRIVPQLDRANALAPFVLVLSLAVFAVSLRNRRFAAALAGLAALCSAERVVPNFQSDTAAQIPAGPGITVMSFNAWRHQDRPLETARAIAESGADIVLLQEAGILLESQGDALEAVFPYRSKCPNRCDLAILSRLPVSDFRYRMRGSDGNFVGPRIVFADIGVGQGMRPITFASIHLDRSSRNPDNQLTLAQSLEELFALLPKDDLVIGGDFNMTPYSFAADRIDRAMQPVRRVSPGDATYPSQVAGLSTIPVFAIDHIYASARWQAAKVETGAGFHSDHRPIAIRLVEPAATSVP